MFETRRVDTTHLLRAIAITMILVNHSVPYQLSGGLNTLFLLSGMSFAALAFEKTQIQKPIAKISWQFVRKLFLASIFVTLFWFVLRRDFNLAELLLFSNWLGITRISHYPVLYPQVVFQMMIMILVLFLVPGMRAMTARRPIVFSLGFLALAVAVANISKLNIDILPPYGRLPHLFLWNFVLGWVFWAVLEQRAPSATDRLALGVFFVGFVILIFPVMEFRGWEIRMWLFPIPVLLLVWRSSITLPIGIAHPILLTSQATLVIFFAHLPIIYVVRPALWRLLGDMPWVIQLGTFLTALLGSMAIWLAITAFVRVWRRRNASPGSFDLPSGKASVLSGAGAGTGIGVEAPAPAR